MSELRATYDTDNGSYLIYITPTKCILKRFQLVPTLLLYSCHEISSSLETTIKTGQIP